LVRAPSPLQEQKNAAKNKHDNLMPKLVDSASSQQKTLKERQAENKEALRKHQASMVGAHERAKCASGACGRCRSVANASWVLSLSRFRSLLPFSRLQSRLKAFEEKLHPAPAGAAAPEKEKSALDSMFYDGGNLSKDQGRTSHVSKDSPSQPVRAVTHTGEPVKHEADTAIKPAVTA
jgi:hypothetical protein